MKKFVIIGVLLLLSSSVQAQLLPDDLANAEYHIEDAIRNFNDYEETRPKSCDGYSEVSCEDMDQTLYDLYLDIYNSAIQVRDMRMKYHIKPGNWKQLRDFGLRGMKKYKHSEYNA